MPTNRYTAPGMGRASDVRPVASATASTVWALIPQRAGSAGRGLTEGGGPCSSQAARRRMPRIWKHPSVHVPLGHEYSVAGAVQRRAGKQLAERGLLAELEARRMAVAYRRDGLFV